MPLSDLDVVDLHCLKAAAESGRVPDGCDVTGYVMRGFLIQYGSRYVITPLGALRLAHLKECEAADT